MGFETADFDDDIVEVWACNWQAVAIFAELSTQWRVGFGGVYGLDYCAVHALFTIYKIKPKKQIKLLKKIKIMEQAALDVMKGDKDG